MEVRVRERLVGALVLVAIVVLLVPAILKGRSTVQPQAPESAPVRRIEMPIGDEAPAPEEQVLVPEPLAAEPRPAAPAQKSPPSDADTAVQAAKPARAPTAVPAHRSTTPTPAAEPAPTAPPASAWAVQLGAFSNKSKAEQLVAELRRREFAAFVLEYRASGQVLYRVRVGPEQDRARAEATAVRLAKEGFQPVVARHP